MMIKYKICHRTDSKEKKEEKENKKMKKILLK